MAPPEVTAIIPVYNDRESLERALPASVGILSTISPSFEIIVAEDGSTDGSAAIVEAFSRTESRVRLLHSDKRQGRGRALNRAIREAQGSIVCYFDVDLATDMQHLPELIGAIRDGYDMATGSRLMPDSDIVRTGGREIASRSYNFLVRLFLSSTIFDHQCGFKAFNRERILTIIPTVRDTHWFWDTELLVRGQRKGFRVKEFAVRWRAGKGTTVKAKDIFSMGRAILRLWWQIHVSKD
ncbi:dolichyl-phosphate beta-glucosyltransferase [Methanoregula formicica]|uniref:Glycosyl transferase n=1 Tax=Methanoregula formicica (strain DSM 22288 / NBRC 105244 / SMSP) TaxID=593750 RepID=L0HFJ6_METFS|nr:dolichyl-phosphate beta-glucosyltransferase [Methanoregula formicica]AGB03512.1 glycosyl transferase [Methanoregula formicica SMSP]